MSISLTNDFVAADKWAQEMGNKFFSRFYEKYSLDGCRFLPIQKSRLSTWLQREKAVDKVFQSVSDGSSYFVEEKIEQWPGYEKRNFACEVMSCTVADHERKGWMHYAEADYLLYGFEREDGNVDAYLINFPKFRRWFWEIEEQDPTHFKSHDMENTDNHSRIKLVPISEVKRSVPMKQYLITESECRFVKSYRPGSAA